MPENAGHMLSGVAETLLIPLCYRAIETQRPDALIKDEKAVELVQQLSSDGPIRYDSDWIKRNPMAEANKVLRIMLTREMDRYARDFLSRHRRRLWCTSAAASTRASTASRSATARSSGMTWICRTSSSCAGS